MPKSKRDKKVSLTKTPKKGMKLKQQLVEDIRKNLDVYSSLFIFTVHNMRNGLLKDLREDWKDSRFFFAKRKVMAIALGRTEAEESYTNLHKLSVHLVGQCGLLFTNRSKDQVIQWFRDYSKMDFAKAGFVATETVMLPAGPLTEFPFSIEPHLRSLGLPTQLEKGKVILREDHLVCSKGTSLTPEQARLLKLLGKQITEFKLALVCMWSKDGSFEKFKLPKVFKSTSKKITEGNEEAKTTKAQSKLIDSPSTLIDVTTNAEQEVKAPKQLLKTPNKLSQKSVDKTTNREHDESRQDETPITAKRELRRSTRTSIFKKSAEESKEVLEKIKKSTKKLKTGTKQSKDTPKTPNTKKTKLSRSQNQLEDIVMSE